MQIFITGGSGFLGQQLLRTLTPHHKVYALARRNSSRRAVELLGAHPIDGSLTALSHLHEILRQCDIVIHAAAPVETWGPWSLFQDNIVDATHELHKAADHAGVKRFIYISSEAVLQDYKDLLDIDESEPYPDSPNSYYGKAKMLAEQMLVNSEASMHTIILRPTCIWGDGAKLNNDIKQKIDQGQFSWIDQGRAAFEMVHVENVAHAVLLALDKGEHKGIYFITDDAPESFREFIEPVLRALGIEPPQRSMPNVLVRTLASVLETTWHLFGINKAPPLNRFEWAFAGMARRYNIERIRSELGYRPIINKQQGLEKLQQIR